jgi:FGGY-family pentulose kinase
MVGVMTLMVEYVLGIDIGTQSLRAAIYDTAGKCVGVGVEPIETTHPHPAWAEQDPMAWWHAACRAVPIALSKAGVSADRIRAIGLDATACTVVACDLQGAPLRPALLWMDQRSFREAEELSQTGDSILRYVSGVVSPEWMLPKALWLRRHEGAVFDRAERIVECTDWFMHRLTGEWNLSLNNVTVKWNYARPEGGWSESMLRQVGLAELLGKWPSEVMALGKGEKVLSSRAARELGLQEGTPVAQGGIDAYLGMIGLGATGAGDLAMILGSSTCHLAQTDRPILGSGLLGCYPDATVEGLFTVEGGQTATGSIIDWYRRHLAGFEQVESDQTGRPVYEILDAKAARIAPGSEGLVCLDYWQGNRCPLKDPLARGTIWGMTLSHTAGHLVRSIYEATSLGTRHLLEDARQFGLAIDRIFAGGGGAQSELWMQIQADVLGQPIFLSSDPQACALGSAIVAATHVGLFGNLNDAAREMVSIDRTIEPNAGHRGVYDDLYGKYLATYEALKPLMHGGRASRDGQTSR